MSELDLKLKLIAGVPIEVDKGVGKIRPLKIKEIIDYGYTEYLMRLHFLNLNINDLIDENAINDGLNLNVFDVMVHYGNDDIKSELENALMLFFEGEKVFIDDEKHIIEIGSGEMVRYIDRDNFDSVREVIKWQNCINRFGDDSNSQGNKESDAVRRIKEKLNASKKMVEQAKKENANDEDGIDLFDIISSISTKSNSLNKLKVFNLTLFQLYDEFKRLELIEQYDIGIKSMLAGAKDVKLKHWSTKIDWWFKNKIIIKEWFSWKKLLALRK